ncbi:MAG: alpha-amylase [Bacteroidales bacterium]|nr:alpha-amylase [Bacteroidales bacterium]
MKLLTVSTGIFLLIVIQMTAQPPVSKKIMPPTWAKEAIWYQIFVERFCNGDKSNDPTPETIITHSDFFKIPADWDITPWNQNWYNQEDWAKKTGGTLDQTLQLRRYGGDLQGVIDKLGYLEELGINAIYLNPINDAPSLHKYDARNYHHIDVSFGPDPKGDMEIIASENPADPSTWQWTSADQLFLKLVKEAHKRNIRVIVDYSWNHTGVEFWAMKDLIKNQQNSAFKDWFNVETFDDPSTPGSEFKYHGWLNIQSLPEIKKVNVTTERIIGRPYEGDINPEAKQHIFEVSKRWLAPNGNVKDGIDGYRLDVADHIGMIFWRDYHSYVKSINPEAYLVGEIWWETYPNRLMNPVPYTSGDVFDAIMFYQVYRPAKYFFSNSDFSINAQQFKDSLKYQWNRLDPEFVMAMMGVSATHDSPRLLTCFNNPGKYKYKAKHQEDPAYKTGKPDEETYQRVKLYLMHQFTSLSAPHIWNGDEMGMWGSDDPDCRKPLWWSSFAFENESRTDADGKLLYNDQVGFNKPLFEYYKSLIAIRKANPELNNGKIRFLETQGKAIAYKRYNSKDEIVVLLNAGSNAYTFHLAKGQYRNLLNGEIISNTAIVADALSGFILKKINK